MRELALFAGAGGGLLGTSLMGWETVAAVEIEPYCREVLMRRQRDGVLDLFPIWDDVRTFRAAEFCGCVDIVTAGFPCQPFSVAGQRKADADERNLWPDTARIIGEIRPCFALLENVPGLVAHPYFGVVLGDLAAHGYDAEWCVLGADDVGAPHRRERLWILAYRNSGQRERSISEIQTGRDAVGVGGQVAESKSEGRTMGRVKSGIATAQPRPKYDGQDVAHTARNGDEQKRTERERVGVCSKPSWWEKDPADISDARCEHGTERSYESRQEKSAGTRNTSGRPDRISITQPRLGRVAHGVAHRVDRLKALGNGQVPAVVVRAWEILSARLAP